MKKQLKFADLFCGGGLGARGAVTAGFTPILSVDAWEMAGATYKDNFSGSNVLVDRIENISPKNVLNGEKIDLLLGSPECTNHSPAKGASPRCEESRRTAFSMVNWAEELKPRWIVMENVPHMRSWARYQELISGLKGLGYNIREQVLNAADFGVPQSRRRLFVTCDLYAEPDEVIAKKQTTSNDVASILDPRGTWKTTPLFSSKRAERTLERARDAIANLGEDASFILVYYGSDGGGGWQTLDMPLRTVTTLDRFALVENINGEHRMRMLQPSELARAMGLPADHLFNHGTRRDKVKLCGNGVCAPVMKAVVETLKNKPVH